MYVPPVAYVFVVVGTVSVGRGRLPSPQSHVYDTTPTSSVDVLASTLHVSPVQDTALAQSYVRDLGISPPDPERRVSLLSGGNQQKAVIAKWLSTQPSVLILDEPTRGVDVGAKAEIHRIIGELVAKGMAVIMISSELLEVIGVCDRVLVMHDGDAAGLLDRADLTEERIMALATGERAA